MKPNIILIGFMGSGKTTLGKMIARKCHLSFYDTDRIIELSSGFKVSDIIQRYGEDYFRNFEHRVLSNLITDSSLIKSPFVLATGGGIVLNSDNKSLLHSLGVVYWLKATPVHIWQRVSRRLYKRPLLSNSSDPESEVKRLLHLRQPLYRDFSDHVLDTDTTSFNDMVSFFLK